MKALILSLLLLGLATYAVNDTEPLTRVRINGR